MGGSEEGWGHFGDDNTTGNTLARASQCFIIHGAVCHEKATLALWGSAEMAPESSLRAGSRVLTTPFGRK